MIAQSSITHSTSIQLDFETIYREHYEVVWRTLRHLGVNDRDLRDMCQNVFLTAYKRQTEFEGRSTVKTWLCGIAKWMASDYRNRATFRREVLVDEPPFNLSIESSQLRQVELGELLAELDWVLSQMRPEYREVFVLFHVEELSGEDIAAILNKPEGTVRSRLSVARKEFSKYLAMYQGEAFPVAAGGQP